MVYKPTYNWGPHCGINRNLQNRCPLARPLVWAGSPDAAQFDAALQLASTAPSAAPLDVPQELGKS